MAKNSAIEWTHHTFNPWWGCTKVSPGCDNCYAANMARRYGHEVWGHDAPRRFLSNETWDNPIIWNNAAAAANTRHRVFCASMADVFESRDDLAPHRKRLFKMIRATTNLDWLVLTKRPHSISKLLPLGYKWPANIWLGTTVENQASADKRIKHLLAFDAPSVRFLSCEPLLGPVDIRRYLQPGPNGAKIDWVICGGESERGARPMDPMWAASLQQQCKEADVPFFFKQWGSWAPLVQIGKPTGYRKTIDLKHDDGTTVSMVCVGKKVAGQILNGEECMEYPSVRPADGTW